MKRKYEEHGYTTEEVKQYLKEKKLTWKGFIHFMKGQAYSVIEGEDVYNTWDVERYYGQDNSWVGRR